jgi:hypothetical protein
VTRIDLASETMFIVAGKNDPSFGENPWLDLAIRALAAATSISEPRARPMCGSA